MSKGMPQPPIHILEIILIDVNRKPCTVIFLYTWFIIHSHLYMCVIQPCTVIHIYTQSFRYLWYYVLYNHAQSFIYRCMIQTCTVIKVIQSNICYIHSKHIKGTHTHTHTHTHTCRYTRKRHSHQFMLHSQSQTPPITTRQRIIPRPYRPYCVYDMACREAIPQCYLGITCLTST